MELLQVPTAAPVYVAVALVPHAAVTAFLIAAALLVLPYYLAPFIRRWISRRHQST